MAYNIVLIEPEIPTNTGNIGRLSLATGSTLHLVKPFGFELNDKRVKRAGLDYWQHLDVVVYENQEAFFKCHADKKMAFFSSHASQEYWDVPYEEAMFFIFGKESVGLPEELVKANQDRTFKIPIHSEYIRSINLANAVSVVVYEGLRNIR